MSNDKSNDGAEIAAFFTGLKNVAMETRAAADAGLAALPRLVAACYPHDNGQAVVIVRYLASCYNGDDARPVQLDDLRRLDWNLRQDLVAVIMGVGNDGFSDTAIREAFRAAGGDEAVKWFHWYTTGGLHEVALKRLVTFALANRASSSGVALLGIFRSLLRRSPAELSSLNYMDDEHTKDLVMILDGLFGRDQGMLHLEDITAAFVAAKAEHLLNAEPAVART